MADQQNVLIRLERLRKEFNGVIAVEGLDLDVIEGEFLCFLGPSGCGKTTTLRMIAGLETPTAGEVYLRGRRITHLPPQQRNVGFVFQNYALFWHMTVYENLAFGLRVRNVAPADIDRRVKEIAASLELADVLHERARRLDLSTMQRVAMARTLVTDPEVLLLDEPLNNFRPGLREVMRGELKRWQMHLGRTMIYVTHDQEEAMTLGDRILVMNAGRCAQLDTPRHIYEHPANLFVASFIGRPPMNLMNVRYIVEGEKAFLVRDSLRVEVTPLRERIEHALRGETELVLGVRPEHLSFGPFPEEGWVQFSLPAVVDLVQPLARKKFLDLKIGDALIKMVVPGTATFRQGEHFPVGFPLHRIRLFHPITEEAIL
ncbi:MAG: ABC transporter ATP-binding protein [Anaerolineae bacterium]